MPSGRTPIDADWCAPAVIVAAVKRAMGGDIELDPCSHKHSIVEARHEWALPYKDGLAEDWCHGTIFVHPPFPPDRVRGTSIDDWLAKCADAWRRHRSEVIALVPTSLNADAWLEHVWPEARGVCFLFAQRVPFIQYGREHGKGFRVSCCFILWGEAFARFEKEMSELGAVVDLAAARMPGRRPNDALRWLYPQRQAG